MYTQSRNADHQHLLLQQQQTMQQPNYVNRYNHQSSSSSSSADHHPHHQRYHHQNSYNVNNGSHYNNEMLLVSAAPADDPIYSSYSYPNNYPSNVISNPLPLPPRQLVNYSTNYGHHRQTRSSFSSSGNNHHLLLPNNSYKSNQDGANMLISSSSNHVNYLPVTPTFSNNQQTMRRSQQKRRNYSIPGTSSAYNSFAEGTSSAAYLEPIYVENIYSNSSSSAATSGLHSSYYKPETAGTTTTYLAHTRDPIYGNLPPPPSQFQNSPIKQQQQLSSASFGQQQKRLPHTLIATPNHKYGNRSQPTTPHQRHSISVESRRYLSSSSGSSASQPTTPYINPITSGQTSLQPLVQRTPSNDRLSTSPSTSSTSAGSVSASQQQRSSTSCPPPIKRIPSDVGQTVGQTIGANGNGNRSLSSASQRNEGINKSNSNLINSDSNQQTRLSEEVRRSISRNSLIVATSGAEDTKDEEEETEDEDEETSRRSFKRSRRGQQKMNEVIILPKDDSDDKYNAKLIAKDGKVSKERRVLFAMDAKRSRRGGSSEVSCLMKYIIFSINFIVMLIGLTLTSVGFWAWKEKDYSISNLNLDPAFALILFGLVCSIIAGTGSIGALRENTTLLGVYAVCLTILLVVELMGGILAFIFKDWIKSQASSGFQAFIIYYRDDPDRQNLIDWIQESWLECCGLEGPKDWDMNIYFNCSSEAKGSREACGVPFSCCKSDNTDDSIFRNNQCGYDVRKPEFMGDKSLIIHEKGCLRSGEEWIESNLVPISAATVIISIFQQKITIPSKINQIGCLYAVSIWLQKKLINIIMISLMVPFIEILGICFAQNLRADIFSQKSKWR